MAIGPGKKKFMVIFDEDVFAALEVAAKDDRRSVSNLINKIADEYARDRGYLPKLPNGKEVKNE